MQKKNCITSLICAAIFTFFLLQCNSLNPSAAYWPRMICIVGLGLSALEILLEGVKRHKSTEKQEKLWVLSPAQSKHALILLGILILWSIGLNTLGFLVSSLIALCGVSIYFEPVKNRRNIIRDVASCLIIGIIVYFTFGYLGVHYPKSMLM